MVADWRGFIIYLLQMCYEKEKKCYSIKKNEFPHSYDIYNINDVTLLMKMMVM
jgi:hypothetical protein